MKCHCKGVKEMRNETHKFDWLPVILSFALLTCLFVLAVSVAGLEQERSINKVQVTVDAKDLLSTVQEVQGFCDCVADAVPLGGEEDEAKYWRITAKYF